MRIRTQVTRRVRILSSGESKMAEPDPVNIPEKTVPLPPYHIDPFSPVMFASPSLVPTKEQEDAVRQVLLLTSSDSRFAQKAADSLRLILLGTPTEPPVIPVLNSVEPNSGTVGQSNLKVKCKGTGFNTGSVIHVNGNPMVTQFVSVTEISTNLNLTNPGVFEFVVRSDAGVLSAPKPFTVT